MKKNKKGNVFVVLCIDAEGPIVDKKKPEILDSWSKVKKLVKEVTDSKYRSLYKDSAGRGIVYSWFVLTLTGFKTNPFKRPMKYNLNFDFFNNNFSKNFKKFNDEIYWHYHQPSKSKIGNEWSKDWIASQEYFNILNRLVADRYYFPSCFRAGGRIEDNDLSNWLEQYIPFDYSNCSGNINWNRIESDGKKLIEVADWSRSPSEWAGYHPSNFDYQKLGNQNRYVFRCLDLKSPVYCIKDSDIHEAFQRALKGKNSVLSVFEHDRRFDMKDNILLFCDSLLKISQKYPDVKWLYKNARQAAISEKKIKNIVAPKFNFKILQEKRLLVQTTDQIFGQSPYVCIKSLNNDYFEVPLNKVGLGKWVTSPIKLKNKFKIFAVANSISGNSYVHSKIINF